MILNGWRNMLFLVATSEHSVVRKNHQFQTFCFSSAMSSYEVKLGGRIPRILRTHAKGVTKFSSASMTHVLTRLVQE